MKDSQRMGTEHIGKLLISFSVPSIIAAVVTSMYNVVDRIFIGNALVSIRLGENKQGEAEMILGNAFGLYMLLGVGFTSFGLIFLDPLLVFFGASKAILPLAREYLFIILLGSLMHEISFGMNNFIRGEGNPTEAMATMLIGALLNVILDPLFIFVLDMGIRGAALATVLSQTVSALWVLQYYASGTALLDLRWRHFFPRWPIVKAIMKIGSPPLVMNLAGCLIVAITNHALVRYGGDVGVSVMGVIFSASMLLMMPLNGLCQGAQPIFGYNHGAGRPDRVRKALILTLAFGTGFALCMFLMIQLGAGRIFQLFNAADTSFVAMGTQAIRINMAMVPLIGFHFVTANYFQAIDNPRVAMFLSMTRQVMFLLPLLVILPMFWGLQGVWLAGPVSDLASAVIAGILLVRELGEGGRLGRQEC